MIKITVSDDKWETIEKLIKADAKRNSSKSLKHCLIDQRSTLQQYFPAIHDYFFLDGAVKPDQQRIYDLLLADYNRMQWFISEWGETDNFHETISVRKKDGKKVNLTPSEWLLKNVFCYKNYQTRAVNAKVHEALGVSVCPYCNRMYVTTLKKGGVTAPNDHYFPESKYPYLALTVLNLIPCCDVCNRAKSDDTEEHILYPYNEEFGDSAGFHVIAKSGHFCDVQQGISDQFDIKPFNTLEGTLKIKANCQIKRLHLEELYATNKDFVQDALKRQYVFQRDNLNRVYGMFGNLVTSEDVLKEVLLIDVYHDHWGDRPLNKLIHDIYWQMNE